MVEIEGSPWIYTIIWLMSVLGKCGVCRDTTRGRRASVDLHAVANLPARYRDTFTGSGSSSFLALSHKKCFPPMNGGRVQVQPSPCTSKGEIHLPNGTVPPANRCTVISPVYRMKTDPTPGPPVRSMVLTSLHKKTCQSI
jgi:hypothetical protein